MMDLNIRDGRFRGVILYLEVLKMIFHFVLGPPSPGGSRGRVRTVSLLRKLRVFGPISARIQGEIIFVIFVLALSAAGRTAR